MAWETIDEKAKIYRRVYSVREFGGPANCLAFAYGDGLAVVSPGPEFDEEDFAFLEAQAPVTAIVVPNAAHRRGVREWRKRFPRAEIYAPTSAIRALGYRSVQGVYPLSALNADPSVRFVALAGSKIGGTLAVSYRGERPVVFLDELILNLEQLPRALRPRLVLWLTGSAPGLKVNKVYLRRQITDRPALLGPYGDLLRGNPILVPSHGELVRDEAGLGAVRALVDGLGQAEAGAGKQRRAA